MSDRIENDRHTTQPDQGIDTNCPASPEIRGLVLDEVEAMLPIPADVLIVATDALPSGLGWWSPAHRVILIRTDLGARRVSTLAHECAHILLGHHGDMPRSIEDDADQLAEVLLARARRSVAAAVAAPGAAA